ncbi:hypothetical protein BSL78_29176 [Apostichopus japonicus]|uniref:Uncharacterized protein n=1 Tax=Stichopus japonicus TaxID=307972 RepID=A0A2G8JE32_STIJA|nr:hypothetical protein BSL78_29176 [Apostichopus japonicus]
MQQIVWKRNVLRKRLGHEFYDQIIRVGILIEEDYQNFNESPGTMEYFQKQRRVRFYHKIFCEWYAAHHFARLIEANPKKCLDNLAKGLDLHELQYLYRFACGLSDSAAMRIITDIEGKTGGMKLSILCTLEQLDGSTKNMRKIVTKLGSTNVSMGEDDNMHQQRATIEILQFAAIPMQGLYLKNLFRSVDIAKDIVTLKSDVSLPCTALKTLTELWITEEGREFTDKEIKDILWYASKCTSLNKLWFVECLLPKSIQCGSLAPATRSWGIDVLWFDHHLNLTTGSWENTSGEDITDEIYNESVCILRFRKKLHLITLNVSHYCVHK